MSGVEGVRVFRERFPEMRVLMLTVYEEEEKVFDSIRNGACGLPPQEDAAESDRRSGAAGRRRRLAALAGGRAADGRALPEERRPRGGPVADRPGAELLRLLAEGHSYQAAADRLGISINTVRDHVRSVYEKLHVHSKSEAVSTALRRGLID